jgi:hypothetical protein
LRIEPDITGVSLVLIGKFNPSIFTPAWFGWQNLLPNRIVDVAELQIAQPQITAFRADWLELQIVQDRFSINTAQPPFVRLRDLAIKIFRERLPHTRLQSVGINRQVHFLANSFEERDHLGRLLAPIEPWGEWGRQLEPDGRHGGMTSLTMTQVSPQDRPPDGRINVTVQPSMQIGLDGTGVYVQVNDHYTTDDPDSPTASSEIVNMLEKHFDESIRRAEQIIDHVMSLAGE